MTGGLDRGLADVGWALLGSVLRAEGLPGRGTGLGITAPGVSAPRPGLKGRQVIPHTGTKPNMPPLRHIHQGSPVRASDNHRRVHGERGGEG